MPPCKGLRDQSSEVPVDHDRIDVDKIDVELCAERISHGDFIQPPQVDEHLANRHRRPTLILEALLELGRRDAPSFQQHFAEARALLIAVQHHREGLP